MAIFTWAATAIALAGTVLNCKKIKACFYLWLITNAMWLAFDVYNQTYSRGVLDLVQFVLAGYGIYEWTKLDNQSNKDASESSE